MMRKVLLNSEGTEELFKNLPVILRAISDQLSSVSLLFSACMEPIENDEDLKARMEIIDELYSYSNDVKDISAQLAELISDRVYEYEKQNVKVPPVSQAEALSFFIKERNLKQVDLREVATQSVISEIIHGKRAMTLEQVKGFSKFFNVPVETFMDIL
ncbi:helix-turn-helix domain-containing protein [Xenorhabdus bharatensis]|uniref:helix-turn-helix domain-containing protein n=1 Tax=Xenorhabdus bharatensis TaxID=3136256 RepID=UPI0030F39694